MVRDIRCLNMTREEESSKLIGGMSECRMHMRGMGSTSAAHDRCDVCSSIASGFIAYDPSFKNTCDAGKAVTRARTDSTHCKSRPGVI